MHTAFYVTLVLVALGIVGPLCYQYRRFRLSPARLWWSQFREHERFLLERRAELIQGPTLPDNKLGKERSRLLDDLFFRTRVRELDSPRYKTSGVGPGTLEKLEAARVETVLHMRQTYFQSLHGIGEGRAYDLGRLLDKAVQLLEQDFDAGRCPEGLEYQRRSLELWTKYEQDLQLCKWELAHIEPALNECEELRERAAGLTFLGHLLSRPHYLSHDLIAAPLPGWEWVESHS